MSRNKKNYIIVTGGAGFVGSNLIEFLIKKTNKKIISIDNYSSGTKKNHIKSKQVKYINDNVINTKSRLNKIKKKIDTIFHFGEFARIHQSFYKINECLNSNINATAEIIKFCLENKIRIIYSATSASLGNNGLDQGLSPYAFSKSKNLKLMIYLNKWFGFKYEALYFYNVYGKRQIQRGNMATVIGIFEDKFKNNKPLPVVKPGNQSRTFTHIQDTVEGCYYAYKNKKNRHYALSYNNSLSILQIAKLFGGNIKFLLQRKGERKKSSHPNKIGKIKIFKYRCKRDIKTYIKNFKNNFIKLNQKK
mgnify:FL=1